MASYRVAVPRGPSQHLAGDHEAEILASPAASAYPDLGPGRVLGADSVLVERLYAVGAASPEIAFVMVKRVDVPRGSAAAGAPPPPPATEVAPGIEPGATWAFLVVSEDGTIAAEGPLEACARCHAEAPHDGVFGRAR